jgi:hypothetical protein
MKYRTQRAKLEVNPRWTKLINSTEPEVWQDWFCILATHPKIDTTNSFQIDVDASQIDLSEILSPVLMHRCDCMPLKKPRYFMLKVCTIKQGFLEH